MGQLKDFYTVRPRELEPGVTLICVVKLVVMDYITPEGAPTFRVYRCKWDPGATFEEPQGSRVLHADIVGKALFPVVSYTHPEMEGE